MVPVDLRIVTKSTTRRARKNQLPFCKKVCFPACSRYALDNHGYAGAFAWACLQDMLRMHDPGLHQVVFSWHISICLWCLMVSHSTSKGINTKNMSIHKTHKDSNKRDIFSHMTICIICLMSSIKHLHSQHQTSTVKILKNILPHF